MSDDYIIDRVASWVNKSSDDKTVKTCKEKFNNLARFAGFPPVPPVFEQPTTDQADVIERILKAITNKRLLSIINKPVL